MMKRSSIVSKSILASLLLLLFAGCGLGTGVVLWPEDESPRAPGDVVEVRDESIIRDTYIINLPNSRLKAEVDNWRIRLFDKEKDAVEWAAGLGEWRHVYAETLFQGLPVRQDPSNHSSSRQVYRLREGERMKVLGREPGPVQVGNLEGYWYHVLCEGGVEGYVFDYHLLIVRLEGDEREVLNERVVEYPEMDNFLAGPWYPVLYRDMVNEGRIDLSRMRPDHGLFPDPEEQTLTLRLPELSFEQNWTEIVPVSRSRFDFLGTSFRVTASNPSFVSVQYAVDGRDQSQAFVRLSQDIDTIIQNERNRRLEVVDSLYQAGPTFGSRSYGNLSFSEDGGFQWTGKSALIARGLLSASAGNTGTVEFDYFPGATLTGRHDGVLGLRFDSGESIVFLYAIESAALRLLSVPRSAIQNGVVRSDQFIDPLNLYFARSAVVEVEDTEEADESLALPDRKD